MATHEPAFRPMTILHVLLMRTLRSTREESKRGLGPAWGTLSNAANSNQRPTDYRSRTQFVVRSKLITTLPTFCPDSAYR
jgi:hypothetical protein